MKAFRVVETPVRGRKLELIDDIAFPEAHGSFQDRVTDMAGRFSVSTGAGPGQGLAHGEALTAELEIERRLVKLVAGRIVSILNAERPEYWYLAATQEVHQAILNALPQDLRERVMRHVFADLTKTRAPEILAHIIPAWAA
ncbi:MAG: host attachment protein, partial [Chthoniobacteraceae bacterium]|nr:host attachment protein [Chthoniobacteraceae bacterium]